MPNMAPLLVLSCVKKGQHPQSIYINMAGRLRGVGYDCFMRLQDLFDDVMLLSEGVSILLSLSLSLSLPLCCPKKMFVGCSKLRYRQEQQYIRYVRIERLGPCRCLVSVKAKERIFLRFVPAVFICTRILGL